MSYFCRNKLMPIKNTLEAKMQYRIKRNKSSVFIPSDFFDLSDRDQIGRVFRQLTRQGLLIKIGQGVYARTKVSQITGKPMPEKDLRALAIETAEKLGKKVVPTRYEKAYNQGKTTQVPTGRVIGVRGRISRKISYNGKSIKYESVS